MFEELATATERAARIAAQVENEALKARLAASGVAERRAVREAVLDERDKCARVCDSIWQEDGSAMRCRDEIRSMK